MFVCLCNALTDAHIRSAVDDAGARRPAEVFAACRCRAQCSTCVRAVCALLNLGRNTYAGYDALGALPTPQQAD